MKQLVILSGSDRVVTCLTELAAADKQPRYLE